MTNRNKLYFSQIKTGSIEKEPVMSKTPFTSIIIRIIITELTSVLGFLYHRF